MVSFSITKTKTIQSVPMLENDMYLGGQMECETTIVADLYGKILTKLRCAIQNRQRRKLLSKIALLHGNLHPHAASQTKGKVEAVSQELFDHLPYGPDHAPGDFFLETVARWTVSPTGSIPRQWTSVERD